jgi:hypothetical protein
VIICSSIHTYAHTHTHSLLKGCACRYTHTTHTSDTRQQVRFPPSSDSGLLGFPPCQEEQADPGDGEKCARYDMQPECGVATVSARHLADPSSCDEDGLNCQRSSAGQRGEDTDLYLYVTVAQVGP